ncbi:MAG: AraC family transcriptional regulator [Sphingobium sp.]
MKRPRTRHAHGRRIDRVLRHIHAHLDRELDLRRLADIACLSPFHFHRIYHEVTGETASATLARLRLHRAAVALSRTDQPLAAIARAAGYGSVPAFSRAFHHAHGRPPNRFRTETRNREGHIMTDIAIQDRPALRLLVTGHDGPAHRIGEAFDKLVAWAAPRGLLGPGRLGVSLHLTGMDVPEGEQRSLAGFTIGDLPPLDDPAIWAYDLPGGRHAVILHKGPYARIGESWRTLRQWFAASGESRAARPAFEVNLNNPRLTPPDALLTEICLPLDDQAAPIGKRSNRSRTGTSA